MYINKLILTPFTPFDIKCKKFNVKKFFRVSRRVNFSYFPKITLNHWGGGVWGCGGGGVPPIPFRIFVDYVTIFNSSPMQLLRWSSPRAPTTDPKT